MCLYELQLWRSTSANLELELGGVSTSRSPAGRTNNEPLLRLAEIINEVGLDLTLPRCQCRKFFFMVPESSSAGQSQPPWPLDCGHSAYRAREPMPRLRALLPPPSAFAASTAAAPAAAVSFASLPSCARPNPKLSPHHISHHTM